MNQNIQDTLNAVLYCVLATVAPDGTPQSVPVRFAFDDDFIYFRSSPDSDHSKNIANSPRVSVTILDTSQATKGALYIHSCAELLGDKDEEHALEVFDDRFNYPENQWDNTAYYRVALGTLDIKKSVDKMFYLTNQADHEGAS